MTNFEDINTANNDLIRLNPELANILGGAHGLGPLPSKKSKKWFNNRHVTDLDGEKYDSGAEAEHAQQFNQAVKAGKYLVYLHHVTVILPGDVKMELDHVLLTNDLKVEVYDTKFIDKKTGKFVYTKTWLNKKKTFEAVYGLEVKLI